MCRKKNREGRRKKRQKIKGEKKKCKNHMDEKIRYNNNRKKGREKYNNKIGNSE